LGKGRKQVLDYLRWPLDSDLGALPCETLFLWGHAIVDEVAKWAGAFKDEGGK